MKQLDKYQKLEQEIFEYFGYQEGWRVFPLSDMRAIFWQFDSWSEQINFQEKEFKPDDATEYEESIYKSRNEGPGIYRGKEFTATLLDTQVDGNIFFAIFDNSKEIKSEESDNE